MAKKESVPVIFPSDEATEGLGIVKSLEQITLETLLDKLPVPAPDIKEREFAIFCWIAALLATDEPQNQFDLKMKGMEQGEVEDTLFFEAKAFERVKGGFRRTSALRKCWDEV